MLSSYITNEFYYCVIAFIAAMVFNIISLNFNRQLTIL